ncbi:hypothetical protein H9P43_002560 [Blastocladiella emersonii ATCC 22665]|nr:hypothetical protein H9P43_002560 [Blastocladiella emersonii ATCC 22665]
MSDLIFDPNAPVDTGTDVWGPIDWEDDFVPDATADMPAWAVIALQVVFYIMLAFILLYLVSHWIFHSWSFVNIFNIGLAKRRKANSSWSDKLMPPLVIAMFLFYSVYMAGFVTVIMLQFQKYFASFIKITTRQTRNNINVLLWVFFFMAMFPVVVNMIAALIKLTRDYFYTRKVRSEFAKRCDEFVKENGLHAAVMPNADGSKVTTTAHSAAAIPGAAEKGLPLVYVMIPTFNEPLPNLMGAINGVAASDYPRLRVYVGFDNYDVEQQFFTLCRLMTGVPLRSETLARRGAASNSPTTPAAAAAASPSPATLASPVPDYAAGIAVAAEEEYTHKAVMGRKSMKYNGFDQIVTATANNAAAVRMSMSIDGRSPAFDPTQAGSASPAVSAFNGTPSIHSASMFERRQSLDFDAENCPDDYTMEYRGVQFTVCRFEHSGKLGTQRNMFERMQLELEEEGHVEDPYILFMDSDTAIMPDTVSQLVAEVQRYPQTRAVTGFVVSRNEDSYNFWRIMQDAEYIESMIYRNAEALMGAVTCLPGVLTMFKYPVLLDVAQDYFYQAEITSTFDFARRYLGEDRYMTHLLMERDGTHNLGFNSHAMCKTEAPSNFSNLLRQRRRWFLGTITNELIMLCTPLFWAKYPILMLTKLFQILKVGGAITYLLLVEVLFNLIFDYSTFKVDYLVWLIIVIIPNWLFVTIWAISEKRLKSVIVYLPYYLFNPFFQIAILMYSFLTVRQRTWGGPRAAVDGGADAPAVDADGNPVDLDDVVVDGQQQQQQR